MNPFRRLRRAVIGDPHQRLVDNIDRVRGYMVAVITDARRLDVPVPPDVTYSTVVWRDWSDHLARPTEDES